MAISKQSFDRQNKEDVRRLITRALERLAAATNLSGINTPQAIELLMGTWAQESTGGKYTTQLGGGPARGMWQIEKPTYLDILNRCSADAYRELLVTAGDPDALLQDHFDLLVSNHTLCAQICRLKYFMSPGLIPEDLEEQAEYWKKYYNTELGAGTVEEYLANYQKYVA
ncbi:MAG: hypothetical protein JZU65_06100 [Chlorobium sp.]|nr:hypothetical protein [Chlorobium sp.]